MKNTDPAKCRGKFTINVESMEVDFNGTAFKTPDIIIAPAWRLTVVKFYFSTG